MGDAKKPMSHGGLTSQSIFANDSERRKLFKKMAFQFDQIWQNFKNIWQLFEGLISIWQTFEPTL